MNTYPPFPSSLASLARLHGDLHPTKAKPAFAGTPRLFSFAPVGARLHVGKRCFAISLHIPPGAAVAFPLRRAAAPATPVPPALRAGLLDDYPGRISFTFGSLRANDARPLSFFPLLPCPFSILNLINEQHIMRAGRSGGGSERCLTIE